MARIFDNIDLKFTKGLQDIITNTGVKRVDFCVGYFNLRGWDLIIDQVDQLPGDFVEEESQRNPIHRTCRLLIGMHQPPEELTRWLYTKEGFEPDAEFVRSQKLKIARDFRRQLQIGLPSAKDEMTLRRLSQQLKAGKVCVKLYLREYLYAKLYLAYRPDDNFNKIMALMGSSNLTWAGLRGNGELNAEFSDSDQVRKLAEWFDARWDDRFCIDITKELIEAIDYSWAGDITIPPYYIYLKTAYHLSEEARNGIREFALSPEFRRELFDFQQTAVKIAARHLRNEKRGGAIIGDVVGLGKTITACAIAKIYETTYASSTLVICPANLQSMWRKYADRYDLKVDIMSMARPIDVDNARYYRLIIIDESHNLRNGAKGRRYKNIKALIDRQGCNVLLLTATPYNKHYSDLSNQLKLFISEDQDLGIRPENYIRELGGERQFMQRHSETFIRSISAFDKSDNTEDWNELMKLFLVRRTRTFIKENYAKTDPTDGRKYLVFPDGRKSYFPERLPKALKFDTEPGDQYSRLYSSGMIGLMESLDLPRYGLTDYLKEDARNNASSLEQQIMDNLSRAGKQQIGFCKSTFFKRIDSCGFSFLLTLARHILRNCVFIYALDNKLRVPVGDENQLPEEYIDDEDVDGNILGEDMANPNAIPDGGLPIISEDLDDYMRRAASHYELITTKGNVSWLDSKHFKRTLKQKLKNDCETLISMIRLCGKWQSDTDQKLNKLYELLTVRHKDEKVVVFTQYSDTANYIYRELRRRGLGNLSVVTGATENPTAEVERFSPVSNYKPDIPASEQYRVIIATDVLSEGQNLQDSHIVVNFDLPWAIIRLIQRAGRVDRIGQDAPQIYCYSFFPADGVEKIISLRKRLNDRINENASLVGSDEIFFEGNEKNLRDIFNEKAGVLDDEDDGEVDLSSQAYQIWKNAIDANPRLKEIIPNLQNMVYSTKAAPDGTQGGVVTYARTYNDFDVLTWLAPDGSVVSNSQRRILQAMSCSLEEPSAQPLANHHELVCQAISQVEQDTANPTSAGILGNRLSTRYRLVELLEHYYRQDNSLFFSIDDKEDLKFAINDIYNYPLLDTAKLTLGQMLRRNQDNDEIVQYVLDLRKNGALCRLPVEENTHREPTIVCSMGIRANK